MGSHLVLQVRRPWGRVATEGRPQEGRGFVAQWLSMTLLGANDAGSIPGCQIRRGSNPRIVIVGA